MDGIQDDHVARDERNGEDGPLLRLDGATQLLDELRREKLESLLQASTR